MVDRTLLPEEFYDVALVLEMGAKKHGKDNWLTIGTKSSHKEMHDSMFHHLAESYSGKQQDHESGLDPLLHVATRALMVYTLKKRNKWKILFPELPRTHINSSLVDAIKEAKEFLASNQIDNNEET